MIESYHHRCNPHILLHIRNYEVNGFLCLGDLIVNDIIISEIRISIKEIEDFWVQELIIET